jgi:hypothetical protein
MLEQSGSSVWKARAGKGGKCGLHEISACAIKNATIWIEKLENCHLSSASKPGPRRRGRNRGAAPSHHGWWRYLPRGCAQVVRAGAHLTVSPRNSVEGACRVLQHRCARPPPAWSLLMGIWRPHRTVAPAWRARADAHRAITHDPCAFCRLFKQLRKFEYPVVNPSLSTFSGRYTTVRLRSCISPFPPFSESFIKTVLNQSA